MEFNNTEQDLREALENSGVSEHDANTVVEAVFSETLPTAGRTGSLLKTATSYWEAYWKTKAKVGDDELKVVKPMILDVLKEIRNEWKKNQYNDIKKRITWEMYEHDNGSDTIMCSICVAPYAIIVRGYVTCNNPEEFLRNRTGLNRRALEDAINKACEYEIHARIMLKWHLEKLKDAIDEKVGTLKDKKS